MAPRVEIAAVASLLRNDMSGVFLLHASCESGEVLAMTVRERRFVTGRTKEEPRDDKCETKPICEKQS